MSAREIGIMPDFEKKTPLNPIWTFGGNTCHAPLLLRRDLICHLDMVKKQLGFKYVRCHGTISDDMGFLLNLGKYNFTKLNKCIDNLLDIGLRPFFEISAMPGVLARNKKSITRYYFRTAPPKNWNLWYDLVKNLTLNLKKRYGVREMSDWFFEVWNEPDIPFWSGTQKEYFKLYDLASRAIKEASPDLKVGGPATSKTAWIPEFIEHISKPSRDFNTKDIRCDFISTHAYPSDLAFLDSDAGEVKLQNSNILKQLFSKVRNIVDEKLGANFPVICGEWNSSAGPLAFNHDECNNAPFIVKVMDELSEICQGSLYWNISDIYEECGFHYQPFHGGYGLITVNDIPKSSFHAFNFLNDLKRNRISVKYSEKPNDFACILTEDAGSYVMLLYYYRSPDNNSPEDIQIQLKGFPILLGKARVKSVVPKMGSAYEKWLEMGSPEFITKEILLALEEASFPKESHIDAHNTTLNISPGSISIIYF